MHVSSASRIKPRVDLARNGFQPARRTRLSTPLENRLAFELLESDRRLDNELNSHRALYPPNTH